MHSFDPKPYVRFDRATTGTPLPATLREFPEALASYIRATKPGEHDRERVAVLHYEGLPFAKRAEVLAALAGETHHEA